MVLRTLLSIIAYFCICFCAISAAAAAAAAAAKEQPMLEEEILLAEPAAAEKSNSAIPPECFDMEKLLQSDRFRDVEKRRKEGKLWKNFEESDFRHPEFPDMPLESPGPLSCNLPRVPIDKMTKTRFETEFKDKMPVIIVGEQDRTAHFRNVTEKDVLLFCFGHQSTTLSTANTYSHNKLKGITLAEYIIDYSKPQNLSKTGVQTRTLFGDHHGEWWTELFKNFQHPARLFYSRLKREPALSFGIADTATGVPLHIHDAVLVNMLHGKKRWFLAPPNFDGTGNTPRWEGDESVFSWLLNVFPTYSVEERSPPRMYDCTLSPGEILFIPDKWYHSTFNIGRIVSISTFL